VVLACRRYRLGVDLFHYHCVHASADQSRDLTDAQLFSGRDGRDLLVRGRILVGERAKVVHGPD
jgi:hypothetical protein